MIREKTFEKNFKERTLNKYYQAVGVDSSKARSLIRKLNFKQDAYLLQCIAQTYFDESLFNDDGTQREYFDARKLRLAEKYIIDAFTINEDCVEVLYTMGMVRKAYYQFDIAIYCFKRIIELGKKKVAKRDNCTDRSLASIKVNDSKFELYRLYHDIGELSLSKRYLGLYKNGLKKGIKTLYEPLENFLLD